MYVVSVTMYSWMFVVTWSCMHLGDFQEENLIAVLYVREEALTDDTVPMLPSLAWFQNNCYMNAALHAVGALCIWQKRQQ